MTKGSRKLGRTIKQLRQAIELAQAGQSVAFVVGSDRYAEYLFRTGLEILEGRPQDVGRFWFSVGVGRVRFYHIDGPRTRNSLQQNRGPILVHRKAFSSPLSGRFRPEIEAIAAHVNAKFDHA